MINESDCDRLNDWDAFLLRDGGSLADTSDGYVDHGIMIHYGN